MYADTSVNGRTGGAGLHWLQESWTVPLTRYNLLQKVENQDQWQ
jgi:hypothetical protein